MSKRHHYGPDGEYQGYDTDESPGLGWFWWLVIIGGILLVMAQ